VPELLPTKPTLNPLEQVGQLRTVALPVNVLSLVSASYDIHDPGGVGVGLPDALGLGELVGVWVALGVGHPGVVLGVAVGPTGFTGTQAENSDVLPLGSVAVAVIT
jgi:hypothetical protein